MTASEEWQLNPYLGWQRQQAIPIHTGFFIEDLRKVPVGYWKARNANGAFINLSNAVAVVVYEAWRQNGFDGGI